MAEANSVVAALASSIPQKESNAPAPPPAPVVEVTVEVTARAVCSRCGKPMLPGEQKFKASKTCAKVEIPVFPLCPCMSEWDGTAKSLLPEAGEETPGTLAAHDGDSAGDRIPRGELKAVKADSK